jgi:hypothetical protein
MVNMIIVCSVALPLSSLRAEAGPRADTLQVSLPALVVFGCSQAERDSLARDENSGIDEILGDFFFYLQRVRPWLDSNSVTVSETSAEEFVVTANGKAVLSYNRKARGEFAGCVLLREGEKPRILSGVYTDSDYREEFERFYKTKPARARGH